MAQTDGTIVGLDQSTGRVDLEDHGRQLQGRVTSSQPPTYVNGMLIIGTSGGDFGAAAQGRRAGREDRQDQVDVQRDPDQAGSSAPTRGRSTDYDGGGAVWAPLARRPGARPRLRRRRQPDPYNGNVRGQGKELFTESVVALHMNTGKYEWHYQEVHHDIWDYDTAANPLVLFDLKIKGRTRQARREHGQDRLGLHARPRSPASRSSASTRRRCRRRRRSTRTRRSRSRSASRSRRSVQPRRRGRSGRRRTASPSRSAASSRRTTTTHYTAFAPTALGGVDWPPSSYSPKTGYMYVCSKDSSGAWKALPTSAVDQAEAARQLLPDRRALPACGQPGPQAPSARSSP